MIAREQVKMYVGIERGSRWGQYAATVQCFSMLSAVRRPVSCAMAVKVECTRVFCPTSLTLRTSYRVSLLTVYLGCDSVSRSEGCYIELVAVKLYSVI